MVIFRRLIFSTFITAFIFSLSTNAQSSTLTIDPTASYTILPTSLAVNATASPSNTTNATLNTQPTTTNAPDRQNTSCLGKDIWDPNVYFSGMKCYSEECAETMLINLETYITCNTWEEPKQPQLIAQRAADYLLLRATYLMDKNARTNFSAMFAEKSSTGYFTSEHGFLRKNQMKSYEPIQFTVDEQNFFWLPVPELEQETVPFQFTTYEKSIMRDEHGVDFVIERTALRQTFKSLGDDNLLKLDGIEFRVNSKIISFSMYPPKEEYQDFVQIRFALNEYKTTTNHRCVKLVNGLGAGHWTDAGCYNSKTENIWVSCKCDVAEGIFAIISELTKEDPNPKPIPRTVLTNIFVYASAAGIVCAFISIMLPVALKCYHLGGLVRVYRYADVTHAVECAVVLIGVYSSEDKETSKVIATIIHFLQHASMMWFVCEGVHLLHGITPLYDEKMGMMFFYSTLAFGVPAAFAGAAAGYSYQFKGITEYVWPYPMGSDIGYFVVPTLGVLGLMVTVNAFLIYDLLSWIGSKQDYLYIRSKKFVVRSVWFTIVFPVTHILGLASMQADGTGFAAYLNGGFLGIQVIQLFYFHFVGNYEIWTHRNELADEKERLEQERLEEEARQEEEVAQRVPSVLSVGSSQHVDIDTGGGEIDHPRIDTPSSQGSQTQIIKNSNTSLRSEDRPPQ